jgi:phage/plasmid-like protein (TIGR03299 family)
MRYESAFALHGGSETVLLARFPQVDTIAEGDHSLRYMAWMNSHDGSSNIIGMPTSVRIVCANTKRLALSRDGKLAIRIRHSANMTQTLALASLKLSQYNAGFDLFRDQAQLLATRLVTRDTQIEYLNTLSPEPAKKSEDTNGKTWTNWQKTRNQIMAALRQPAQNLPAIQGTWWALFNAVTAATDHNGTYQGTERAKSESRFMTLVDGPKSIFKDKAFDLACEMASVSLNNAA